MRSSNMFLYFCNTLVSAHLNSGTIKKTLEHGNSVKIEFEISFQVAMIVILTRKILFARAIKGNGSLIKR